MLWIEQVVRVALNQNAGDAQNHRCSAGDPFVADGLQSCRGRIRAPQSGKICDRQSLDQAVSEGDRGEDVGAKDLMSLQMNQYLKRGEGGSCRGVHHRDSLTVPAAAKATRAFAGKCVGLMFFLDDSPGADGQEYTPNSSRPMRSSTARAPISDWAHCNGT